MSYVDLRKPDQGREGEGGHAKLTWNIFATLSNFKKLNMCEIRNPRTARDARASNQLKITAGGHCHVISHSRITRPRHKNSTSRFFLFHSNESLKIFRLISQDSLSSSLKKRYYTLIFFYEFDSRKGDSDLSVIVTPSPGVTLLSKSSHECGR